MGDMFSLCASCVSLFVHYAHHVRYAWETCAVCMHCELSCACELYTYRVYCRAPCRFVAAVEHDPVWYHARIVRHHYSTVAPIKLPISKPFKLPVEGTLMPRHHHPQTDRQSRWSLTTSPRPSHMIQKGRHNMMQPQPQAQALITSCRQQ